MISTSLSCGKVIQIGDDRPAVHLRLVDLLRAVIQPRGVAQPDRIGGGRTAGRRGWAGGSRGLWSSRVRRARGFQHALDHEHHVRAPGMGGGYSSKTKRDIVLIGPSGQDAPPPPPPPPPSRNSVICLPSLRTMAILADEIDTRDVAVEIDAHAGPVQERAGDLLDMGRFAWCLDSRSPSRGGYRRSPPRIARVVCLSNR